MAELSAKAEDAAHEGIAGQELAPPLAPADPAIDRAHLRRMTQGEAALEREVLDLFMVQAGQLLTRMRAGPPAVAAALAHTLNGSARGIGAWRVAEAAAAVEDAAAGGARDLSEVIERLTGVVCAAQVEIAELSDA